MIYSTIITNGILQCGTAITSAGPEVAIKMAADCGYDAVQLTIASPSDYDIPALKALLKEHGLFVNALATGQIYSVENYSMGSDDEENRKMCVTRLCELVEVCQELDSADLVIGAVRGCTSDAAAPELYHQQFEKSLAEVCDYAKGCGVTVILELIDYLESDCCNKIPEMEDYLARLNRDNLVMYLDTMHMYYEKEDICAVIKEYGSKIPQIDISGEERINPFDSVIDFDAAMKALSETDFDGVLNMEFDFKDDDKLRVEALKYIKGFFED